MNSDIRILICAFAILLSGCKNSFDEPAVYAGNADFSKYVAVGGYFTSGFGDGALHYDLQKYSFPAILASRFEMVGGGVFKQPDVNPGNGLGFDQNSNVVSKWFLELYTDCLGNNALKKTRTTGDVGNLAWIGPNGPYNNLGVPGAKVVNLNDDFYGRQGHPNSNPYFSRFASNNIQSSTILGDAELINYTFFTLWIGSEDIWLYAKSGGMGDFSTDTTDIKTNDITPVARFSNLYMQAVAGLSNNNSKGVLANIPGIDCIPYFTAIPYNGLVLTQAQADALNASSVYTFHEGQNPFVILPPNSSNSRQMSSGEYVLLSVPYDSILCYGLGTPQHPIPDYYILDSAEVANINSATSSYNSIIANAATTYDLAFVDMNSYLKQFKTESVFNGVIYTSSYLNSSIFSIDGLYPNARGNAYIANEFIKSINAKYMSTIPLVDVNSYPGVTLP